MILGHDVFGAVKGDVPYGDTEVFDTFVGKVLSPYGITQQYVAKPLQNTLSLLELCALG